MKHKINEMNMIVESNRSTIKHIELGFSSKCDKEETQAILEKHDKILEKYDKKFK